MTKMNLCAILENLPKDKTWNANILREKALKELGKYRYHYMGATTTSHKNEVAQSVAMEVSP